METEQARAATTPAPSPAAETPPAVTSQDQWADSPQAYDAAIAEIAALAKASKTAPVTTEPPPVVPAEVQTQPEPPAPETPPEAVTAETPAPPVEETGILPERIRTSQFDDFTKRAIAYLKDLKQEVPDATLRDAMRVLEVQDAEAEAAATVEAEERQQRTEAAAAPVTARDTRIAELEALQDADAENETLVTKEYRARQRELDDLKAERLRDQMRQERAIDTQRQQAQQTLDRVHAEYPTANDIETPFGAFVEMTISDMKAKGDNRWKGPQGPMNAVKEAERRALKLGMSAAVIKGGASTAPATASAPPAVKPLVKPPAVVAAGSAGPGAPPAAPKLSDFTERNLTSADELDAMLGAAASRIRG
jgi:hypothetical protein